MRWVSNQSNYLIEVPAWNVDIIAGTLQYLAVKNCKKLESISKKRWVILIGAISSDCQQELKEKHLIEEGCANKVYIEEINIFKFVFWRLVYKQMHLLLQK